MFLNLSKEEQRTRFLKRIDLPEKNWKFSAADARERQRWDDYQHAFSEMLSATSTRWAPWYVIPADRKWFARICAAAVLVHTLIEHRPAVPGGERRRGGRSCCGQGGTRGRGTQGRRRRPVRGQGRGRAKRRRSRAKKQAKQGEGREATGADCGRVGRLGRPGRPDRPLPGSSEARIGGIDDDHCEPTPRASLRRRRTGQRWYARSAGEVAAALEVDPAVGLTAAARPQTAARERPERTARGEAEAGLAPVPRASTAATCRSSWSPPRSCRC